jgi:hypothetical protein
VWPTRRRKTSGKELGSRASRSGDRISDEDGGDEAANLAPTTKGNGVGNPSYVCVRSGVWDLPILTDQSGSVLDPCRFSSSANFETVPAPVP